MQNIHDIITAGVEGRKKEGGEGGLWGIWPSLGSTGGICEVGLKGGSCEISGTVWDHGGNL